MPDALLDRSQHRTTRREVKELWTRFLTLCDFVR